MKILKHRGVAIAIAVVVMIVMLVVGVNRTAARMTRDIEGLLHEGMMNDQGFREPSIMSQLDRIADVALNMASMLRDYPELEQEVEHVLANRRYFLIMAQGEMQGMAHASLFLQESIHVLVVNALNTDLVDRDMEAVRQYWQTFIGASRLVNNSLIPMYNEAVREFYDGRSVIAALLNTVPNNRPFELWPYFSVDAINVVFP